MNLLIEDSKLCWTIIRLVSVNDNLFFFPRSIEGNLFIYWLTHWGAILYYNRMMGKKIVAMRFLWIVVTGTAQQVEIYIDRHHL
jgi:hypothetical protein